MGEVFPIKYKRIGLCLAFVCLAVFSAGACHAADDDSSAIEEIKQLRQIINDLQQRLTELENKLNAAETEQVKSPEQPQYPGLKLDGSVQARYSADDAEDGRDEFLIRRARLNLRGTISEHISSRVQIGLDGRLPGRARGSNVYLREAYIDYANSPNRFRFGQATIPFGYEAPMSSARLWSGERAFVIDTLFPDVVDLGAQYQYNADPSKPIYNLALFNGTGMNQNDNNSRKNPLVSVYVPVGTANATVGYYDGVDGSGIDETDQTRLGGGFRWDGSKFAFMGEYITGKNLGESVAGWYSQLGYKLPKASLVFVKYDQYDENTDQPNDLFKRTTVGWFRDFTPNHRVTLVYELRDPEPGFSNFSRWNGNAGYAQWQVIY